jgi:hypothetical protein
MCAVVKRCGVKRNTAAVTWICRVGKDIYPESEMSGMERNERMNDSSCVGLALRCEWRSVENKMSGKTERTRLCQHGKVSCKKCDKP